MKDVRELKDEARQALDETREAREQQADDAKTAVQLSIIIAVFAVVVNVAFYFLSDFYYAGKKSGQSLLASVAADPINSTRIAFAVFTGAVSVSLIGSMFAPRQIGHALASAAGIASMVAAFYAFRAGMPNALSVALLVLSFAFPLLVWRSLAQSRAAWSFLVAVCWVLGVVLLFGAPKLRSKMDIGLWTAMIIPGLLIVAGVALTFVRRDYRNR